MTTNHWSYCWFGKSHDRKSVFCDGVSKKRDRISTPRRCADTQENLRGPNHHKSDHLPTRGSGTETAKEMKALKAHYVMRWLQCEDVSSYFSCLVRVWHDSGSMLKRSLT